MRKKELETKLQGPRDTGLSRIAEQHGNVLIAAETTNGETWQVSSTRISDNEPLSISSLRGPFAEFEAGREFQRLVIATLQSQDSRRNAQ